MKKRLLGIVSFIICLIAALVIQPPAEIPAAGFRVIALLTGTIILWITEAIPPPVGGMLFVMMVPILGIQTFEEACSSFFNQSVLFVMSSFGFAIALLKTDLLMRVLKRLLKSCGRNANKTIYAFSLSTALLSSICQDLASMLLFNGLAMSFLKALGEQPGKSVYGRALMISISFAALLGGIATPAGSAINVMALQILENNTGITCPFLLWSAFGIPLAFVLTVLSAWVCTKVHKSKEFDKDAVEILEEITNIPKEFSRNEKCVGTVVILMLIAWISSTWVPQINTAMVSIVGLIVLMLPGVDVLDWREYQEGTAWNSIVFMGSIMVVASAVSSTGIAVWIVEEAMKIIDFATMPTLLLFIVVAAFVGVMHIPVPAGPALMGVVVLPCIMVSEAIGINPLLLTMTCGMMGSCAMVLPFDAVPLITYREGYYSVKDYVLCGGPVFVGWIILAALVMTVASQVM